MAYIFMDESGDLGFNFKKKKTSKYFVITCLFALNKRPLERIVKNIFKSFTKKEIKFHQGSLHCYKETAKIKNRVLAKLSELENVSVLLIYLNKKKVYTKLQDEKHVLYNYVSNILLDRICSKQLIPLKDKVNLIVSRRETNKFLNLNFHSYLKTQILNNHKINIDLELKRPYEEKSLQIVDFASWAIFRNIEHGDKTYYEIIKDKIVEENPLFP